MVSLVFFVYIVCVSVLVYMQCVDEHGQAHAVYIALSLVFGVYGEQLAHVTESS